MRRRPAAANVVQANVKRASEPSALKITDLRIAVVVNAPMTLPADPHRHQSGTGRMG